VCNNDPWQVNLNTNGNTKAGSILTVTANITYPCPKPFDCETYTAYNSSADIILPPGMHLQKGLSHINIGDIKAGGSSAVTWKVKLDTDRTGSWITVRAEAPVSVAVPNVIWPGVFLSSL
jgi:hypothetical protein